MRRGGAATKGRVLAVLAFAVLVLLPPGAGGHELDHPAPGLTASAPPSPTFVSGGRGARWQLVKTFPTGNPHTDIDFFTSGGDVFGSVGTLGAGPNGGGQTIVRLTDDGRVAPRLVAGHPSAECPSNPDSALGLQHDVEASPKGNAILNAPNPGVVRDDAQVVVDASDAPGRCHDGGVLGLAGVPQGGLEIVDVTKLRGSPETCPARQRQAGAAGAELKCAVELGLTSHIGESHTVNVDPKRPHIAYSVTSDAVGFENGRRQNEVRGSGDERDLDGFEVVDMSSCMNFPAGTTVAQKRSRCRPEVFRYRYPSARIALGHTLREGSQAIYGCHELEVYADDRVTCGSGNAAMVFDLSEAFDDNGTPRDFSDDTPRGDPLPCRTRPSSSVAPFFTEAMVTDCVNGRGGQSLDIPSWRDIGSPSLGGVRYMGSAHHQGRGGPFDATKDIDFDHELELTPSRRFLLATDERGGGVVPPGATCSTSPGTPSDNKTGNGGIHAYRINELDRNGATSKGEADRAYARTREGARAIYRTDINTPPQGSFCTAHVFQQIPGQNRIFMGWYSQGTQVVDFVERRDGTIEFSRAGFFVPDNANTWVSHIFKVERNPNGTLTYYGATGDFNFGARGRSAVDVYKVTLPPPPRPMGSGGPDEPGGGGGDGGGRRIEGTSRDDVLFGTAGDDVIICGAGDDRVDAGEGDDTIMCGSGDDRVDGGPGDDRVEGDSGNDVLDGGPGDDVVSGGTGDDRVVGGPGDDQVEGGPGRNSVSE